jgi:hypothetical protein
MMGIKSSCMSEHNQERTHDQGTKTVYGRACAQVSGILPDSLKWRQQDLWTIRRAVMAALAAKRTILSVQEHALANV